MSTDTNGEEMERETGAEPLYLPNGEINLHVYGLKNPGDPGFEAELDPEWRSNATVAVMEAAIARELRRLEPLEGDDWDAVKRELDERINAWVTAHKHLLISSLTPAQQRLWSAFVDAADATNIALRKQVDFDVSLKLSGADSAAQEAFMASLTGGEEEELLYTALCVQVRVGRAAETHLVADVIGLNDHNADATGPIYYLICTCGNEMANRDNFPEAHIGDKWPTHA